MDRHERFRQKYFDAKNDRSEQYEHWIMIFPQIVHKTTEFLDHISVQQLHIFTVWLPVGRSFVRFIDVVAFLDGCDPQKSNDGSATEKTYMWTKREGNKMQFF